MPGDAPPVIAVEVIYCPAPGVVDQVRLELPLPCTLADALAASGIVERHRLDAASLRAGVWGKAKPADHPLRDHDRVEVYRPLLVDPKEARRQRYQRHRAAAAGRPQP